MCSLEINTAAYTRLRCTIRIQNMGSLPISNVTSGVAGLEITGFRIFHRAAFCTIWVAQLGIFTEYTFNWSLHLRNPGVAAAL